MKRFALDAALGLAVAASLTVAMPASATRWHNLGSPASQPLFLSVAGGLQCMPGHAGCWLPKGKSVILWGGFSWDQEWKAQQDGSQSAYYPDIDGNVLYLSVGAASTAPGAQLVVWSAGASPNLSPDQVWYLIPAESYGAPFPGCYVFYNANSGLVMGAGTVAQGAQVIQWQLIGGIAGQDIGWHKDQFWCPQ